jgi:hypothetical protein
MASLLQDILRSMEWMACFAAWILQRRRSPKQNRESKPGSHNLGDASIPILCHATLPALIAKNVAILLHILLWMENHFTRSSGFVVTFWSCVGMRTEFRDIAENFGRNFFARDTNFARQRLYGNYLLLVLNRDFIPEVLE